MSNFLSPFSTPVSFESASGLLIGKPKNAPEHPGWGVPYFDSNGVRIFPGTEGGAEPFTSLGMVKGVWKERKTHKLQSVGNISWRGKKKSNTGDARIVVTFSGPPSRCFHIDSFTYGQDSEERYIYKDGGVAAIAPGSVTGAAITKLVPTDVGGKGEELQPYLVAVVLISGVEKLMVRPLRSSLIKADITPEVSEALSGYRAEDNPDGWIVIGQVGYGGFGPPTVPWLFNEDGTEAQTIRMRSRTVTSPSGTPINELAGERVKLVLTSGAVNYTVLGNSPPYYLREEGALADAGIYSVQDPNDVTHTWQELYLTCKTKASGRQTVAVDYIGNTEVVVDLVIDTDYDFQMDYMKGLDADDPQDPYNNYGQYGNYHALGVPEAHHPGDHGGSLWLGGKNEAYLSYTVNGVETRILLEYASQYTSDTKDGRPYDPNNTTMFYREVFVQSLRFLDVRSGGFIAARSKILKSFAQTSWGTTEEFEGYDIKFTDYQVNAFLSLEANWAYVDESSVFPIGHQTAPAWNLIESLGAGYTWLWSMNSYLGTRPTDNDSNALGYVGYKGWFPVGQTLLWEGWFGMKLLRHSHHTKDSGFVHLADGTFIISGDFVDPNDGVIKSVMTSSPLDVEELTGGKSFHPFGEI